MNAITGAGRLHAGSGRDATHLLAGFDRFGSIGAAIARRVTAATASPVIGEAQAWCPLATPTPTPAQSPVASAVVSGSGRTAQPGDVTLARLAQAAYDDGATLPSGWREATSVDMRAIGVRAVDLSSRSSAYKARVYVEGDGPAARYVVAFRGSTSDRGDWISNGRQSAGLASDHYTRAMALGERLGAARAPNVTITGHSLGGGLASAASLASGHDAVTFNAAGLSDRTIADARAGAGRAGADIPDIRAYHVRGEVLSAMQDGGDRMLGALLGTLISRSPAGGVAGHAFADAPSAYGTRVPLNAVRPQGVAWWQDNAVARHGMDYVLTGLGAR